MEITDETLDFISKYKKGIEGGEKEKIKLSQKSQIDSEEEYTYKNNGP